MAFRKTILFLVISHLLFSFLLGAAGADNDTALLTLSLETSKRYELGYKGYGTDATIYNVTITGRLLNTTNSLGIPHQDISLYYQSVSTRLPMHDSEWSFISNTSTDSQGYYSCVWIPPTMRFQLVEEYEVIYRVKASWQYTDSTGFGEVFISTREAPANALPLTPSPIYIAQPFLVTGLLLSGSAVLSIVIFNKFGNAEGTGEKSKSNKKTAVYLAAFLSLWFAFVGLSFLADLIHISYMPWWLPTAALFSVAPILLILSIPFFFRHLKRGNKLKTILSSIVVTWAALQILILCSAYLPVQGVLSLFFTTQGLGYSYFLLLIVYLLFSATLTFVLFLLLVFLK